MIFLISLAINIFIKFYTMKIVQQKNQDEAVSPDLKLGIVRLGLAAGKVSNLSAMMHGFYAYSSI